MEKKSLLVIGSGGCEDAICWKLGESVRVAKIFALPGSFHIGQRPKVQLVENVSLKNHASVVEFCRGHGIHFVVVADEEALMDGIVDSLLAANIKCFGPTFSAAKIETDRLWAKEFLISAGISTTCYENFENPYEASELIRR